MARKGLFLTFMFLSFLLLALVAALAVYIAAPRLGQLHPAVPEFAAVATLVFLLVAAAHVGSIAISALTERTLLFPRGEHRVLLAILLPVVLTLGRILRVPLDALRRSFVEVNNSLVRGMRTSTNPRRILLLLPACIQNPQCQRRVTARIQECRACGGCSIGLLKRFTHGRGARLSVATGGALAREVVLRTRPAAIVAVGCEREIVSGIRDVYPIPVLGIPNRRPSGPCYSAVVDHGAVEHALLELTGPVGLCVSS